MTELSPIKLISLTRDVLLGTPHLPVFHTVVKHALEEGLMAQCIGVSDQCQVSPGSSDGNIAASDLM